MDQTLNQRTFKLKRWQDDFIFEDGYKFKFLKSGWGTGKTLALILAGIKESEDFQDNLGVIFRREFTDLRDSTIKDFESYTGLTVNASREVRVGSSLIMFRHLEELNNLGNINLGWYGIEQAEELDGADQFNMLTGRLRRTNASRRAYIISNAKGHNWIYNFRINGIYDGEGKRLDRHYTATTLDNSDILPADFVSSLNALKVNSPEIYQRFVLNSDDVADQDFVVIPMRYIRESVDRVLSLNPPFRKRVTVCDVAGESEMSDETVIYDFENWKIVNQEIYKHRDLMDTVGRIQSHVARNGSNFVSIDKIGEGSGVYSRLREVYEITPNVRVNGFDSRVSAPMGVEGSETYSNYKAYAWFRAYRLFKDSKVTLPNDEILINQLSAMTYKYESNGKIRLETKDKVKEKLGGRSPDRSDALVMGLDAVEQAEPVEGMKEWGGMQRNGGWVHPKFRESNRVKPVYLGL